MNVLKRLLNFCRIAIAIGVIIFGSIKIYDAIKPIIKTSNPTVEEIALSEDEYKAQCSSVSYEDIARNPNDYIGQKAVFKGKVAQVQKTYGQNIVLRVDVTKGQYGWWDDTIYVDYKRKDDNESRVLDDDIVTVYGEIIGIKDYIAVLGNQISIPHIKAEYIDIQ